MKVILISTDENRVGLGVRTLSACLLECGMETSVVLLATSQDNYEDFEWNDLYELCAGAGLIVISCMTHGVIKAMGVMINLRKKIEAPIIVGGIHASLDPENMIRDFPLLCHGEGEDLVVELARRLKDHEAIEDIPGLWLYDNGNIIKNLPLPLARNINDYPLPDYDISHQYVLEAGRLVNIRPVFLHMSIDDFVVLGSRGCPHHCTYCSNSKIQQEFPWRRKVVHYSIDHLINHLVIIRNRFPEVKSFWIEDDTFFAKSIEEIRQFSVRYKQEVNLPFQILISPWTYHKEKLDMLIGAGMFKLIMGIQSGSERVNYDVYSRRISNEKTLQIARSLHEYADIEKCYDFIGMNPFENIEDLLNTINFIKEIPPPYFIFNNNLAFYPGTELYNRAVESGFDVSLRVKHSESKIGYNILLKEPLPHKLLHLLLLLMAGKVTVFRVGYVPRMFLNGFFMRMLSYVDTRHQDFADGVAMLIAALILNIQFRKIVKGIIGQKNVTRIQHCLYRVVNKRI